MCNNNLFNVAYPKNEESITLVFNNNLPINSLFIGMTFPFSSYRILRKENSKQHIFEYVLEGKGEITLNGKKFPLKKGDTFFLDKYTTQDYRSDKDQPLKKIWVSFNSEYLDKMLSAYKITSGVYNVNTEKDFLTIYNISRAQITPQNKFFTIADSLHQIITTISKKIILSGDDTISSIKNELLYSIYDKRSLDEIASKLFMSRSNLIRIFKKHTGETPYAFLLSEKLKVAKTLLSSTDMTVKTVSELLQFSDEHYFSYLFKQKIGKSPTEYRK
jgi:AraC-like DNA-binding protein